MPPRSSPSAGEKVVPATPSTARRPRPTDGGAATTEAGCASFSPVSGAPRREREGWAKARAPAGGGWGRGARVAGIPARGEAAPGHCEAAARRPGSRRGGGRAARGGGGLRGARRGWGQVPVPRPERSRSPRGPGTCSVFGGVARFWLSEGTFLGQSSGAGVFAPPPRNIGRLEDARPVKLESPPPAERRTSTREAFPGRGGRMRGSHRLGGGQGSADTSPSRRARQTSPGTGGCINKTEPPAWESPAAERVKENAVTSQGM